ncbi:MAG: 4Fe-4S dicluster domain-containing protein [Actinomycetota bacterium]|nr:4Fe-4S dicluster domain-containing protein [Actinomycetota bacterium]
MDFEVKELVYRSGGDTGDFISFDPGRCDGCGLCARVCSAGLWSLKEGKARLAPRYRELCLECAACWEICAREAIDFSYPAGGTGVTIRYG